MPPFGKSAARRISQKASPACRFSENKHQNGTKKWLAILHGICYTDAAALTKRKKARSLRQKAEQAALPEEQRSSPRLFSAFLQRIRNIFRKSV